MKTLLALITLMALKIGNVYADQESEKGRVDDCYQDLIPLAQEMNEANMHGDQNAWKANKKYSDKGTRCKTLKNGYEKKYGKYVQPKH